MKQPTAVERGLSIASEEPKRDQASRVRYTLIDWIRVDSHRFRRFTIGRRWFWYIRAAASYG